MVAVAVAEHHRLDHEPAGAGRAGGGEQVLRAPGPQGIGRHHALVACHRLALERGRRVDDDVEGETVHGAEDGVGVQEVGAQRVRGAPAEPGDLVVEAAVSCRVALRPSAPLAPASRTFMSVLPSDPIR